MAERSWPQRHTAASKAGLQRRGGSLRELVKSGLVTVLTTEGEGQAGECNKTFCFSLSWTLFPSLCLNTLFLNTPFSFLSRPTLNLPPFFLSSTLPRPYALSASVWNASASQNSEMASFETRRKGKQRTQRFLCTSVLAVAGEGTACFLAVSDALAKPCTCVHKATKQPRPKCEIRTQMPPLPLSQQQPRIHTKTLTNKPPMHTQLRAHTPTHTCTKWQPWA